MRRIISLAVICNFAGLLHLRAQDFAGNPFVAGCAQIFVTGDVEKKPEKIHQLYSQGGQPGSKNSRFP